MSNEKQNLDQEDREKLSGGYAEKNASELTEKQNSADVLNRISAGSSDVHGSSESAARRQQDSSVANRISAGSQDLLYNDESRKKIQENPLD